MEWLLYASSRCLGLGHEKEIEFRSFQMPSAFKLRRQAPTTAIIEHA